MAVTSTSLRSGWVGGLTWGVLNFLQLLFTVGWTALLFGPALLLLLACGGRRHWPLRMASRVWAPPLLLGAGVRLELHGLDAIDFTRPCIIVANHQSMMDICVLYRVVPAPLRFVLKAELGRVPLIGHYARAMGMVFIERQAAREASRALDSARNLFAEGDSLCAFPEGTRSRDGRVGPFKGGVFKLAIEAGVPILPMAIEGSGAVLPASGFKVRPGRIRVRAGALIQTQGLEASARQTLANQCRDAVIALQAANSESR